MLANQDLRGLMRSFSLALPISRSTVHLTSEAVKGLPSCHLTSCRSGKVSSVPSSFQAQPVARSGTIERRLFCGMCWSNMTRLLNTPDIGRLTACVDSSSIDMLAGLSKCPIFRIPPCLWAAAIFALDAASSSENATASTHGPRVMPSYLLFMDGLHCPSEPARFRVRLYCPTRATAVAQRGVAKSIAGGVRSCTCRRYLCPPTERVVDLADRTAACRKTDKPENEGAEHVPEGEIEKARKQRIERCLRLDVVGRTGNQRQTRWADELAEVADAVDETHAAAAQPPRPQLAHVGADDRVVAAAEEALQQ